MTYSRRIFVKRHVNVRIYQHPMITQMKDAKGLIGDMAAYEGPNYDHLSMITRIVGVCTAVGESQ